MESHGPRTDHALSLVEEIRNQLKPVHEKLLQHPYVESLERKKVPLEKLRLFAGEQYSIIASDLRSVAHLVSRFGGSPSHDFFLGILQGEKAAWDALQFFARALGLKEKDLLAHEPLAGAHAYTAYMAWFSLYGADADVAAAFLVNFPAWGMNCGRLSRILQTGYGFKKEDVAFFELFASPPTDFERKALGVVQHGLERGADPVTIRRGARLLQAYELMYWDTLYQASVPS